MTMISEKGNITIHTESIFPIIKKWLYSDHEIFLRELVSNGVDAIHKLRMLARSGEYDGDLGDPKIEITLDRTNQTLAILDNGLGMTAAEVKQYINQVAFSSAEAFVQKYQSSDPQQIIGHFGLGFYSAFMVASRVEIDTLSYQAGAQAVHWSCDGSTEFTLEESSRPERGTTVTLTLQADALEYLEPSRVRQLVKTYCDFLPVPIYLDGEQINRQKAPWKESPQNLTREDYLEFYRYLYPFQEDPLLWVHLNTDYPFVVNGILYFPKLRPDVDVTKSQLKLFCNQVFVSDHCEEVVPRFLLPMQGVIDSSDIPLNVSRSFLQNDRTVRRIADYIAKKVGDRLKEVYRNDRPAYINSWQDLGTFVKFGALNDEKFRKQVEEVVIYRSTAELGDPAYTNLQEYLERNRSRHENRVFYCTDPATQASYVQLHRAQGLEVLFMDSFIDTHFITFLEQEYKDVKFSRVDADLDDSLVQPDQGTDLVDPKTNKTRRETIQDLFRRALDLPKLTIRTEALRGDNPESTPPAIVLLPENQRRLRDMTAMMTQQPLKQFPEEHTLVVNTAHPLIQNLLSLSQGSLLQADGPSPSGELATLVCQHVYDLALMAQKAFDAETMQTFLERSNQVLTRLTNLRP